MAVCQRREPFQLPFHETVLSDTRYLYSRYIYVSYVREDPPMRARMLTHGHRIISILNPIDISQPVIIPPRLTTVPRISTFFRFLSILSGCLYVLRFVSRHKILQFSNDPIGLSWSMKNDNSYSSCKKYELFHLISYKCL